MKRKTPQKARRRAPLSRDRVLEAALGLADRRGVEALSMRTLARELGVEAMSLYKHVASKDDVLDGLVDLVVGRIEVPPPGSPWREAMRDRARSARQVFLRHPWAAALFESRLNRPTPVRMKYSNAVLGLLLGGGFRVELAYRAFLVIDSYLYGFILQEVGWRTDRGDVSRAAKERSAQMPIEEYPHIAEVMAYVVGRGDRAPILLDDEFDQGLVIVLEGLERLRAGS